ncbi:hypothetical protein [Rhizobium leguminosarum]
MSDFSKAVLAGLKSAKDADRDTREIYAAIVELAAAVEQVTEGVVTVVRDRVTDNRNPVLNAFNQALASFTNLKWLTSINLKRKISPISQAEIARIDIPSTGYPCEVMYGTKKLTCYDRTSLDSVLEGLLSSADAGKILLRLMNMKAEEPKPEKDKPDAT